MRRLRAALVAGAIVAGAAPLQADPAGDYMLHCRGCHGADGRGAPPDVPDLRGELAQLVLRPGGREFVMRVPGVTQTELDPGRTAALLNWMVVAFGPLPADSGFVPFTAAEVARFRSQPLVDVAGARPH